MHGSSRCKVHIFAFDNVAKPGISNILSLHPHPLAGGEGRLLLTLTRLDPQPAHFADDELGDGTHDPRSSLVWLNDATHSGHTTRQVSPFGLRIEPIASLISSMLISRGFFITHHPLSPVTQELTQHIANDAKNPDRPHAQPDNLDVHAFTSCNAFRSCWRYWRSHRCLATSRDDGRT